MNLNHSDKTGIYIAYLTGEDLQSIYKPKNYKTEVNNQHTKVGITKSSFSERFKCYSNNFGESLKFIPFVEISKDKLQEAERHIIAEISKRYKKTGYAKEWFQTSDRNEIKRLIIQALEASGTIYKKCG